MAQAADDSDFRFPASPWSNRLDVFLGAASPAEARIYARLDLSADEAAMGCRIAGRVIGPECAFSQTLPARVPMLDRSEGNRLLLESAVPDPCFWTPELPFLYRMQIDLRRDGDTIDKHERFVGIRRFGVRDRSLYFEGKRFVLRAVRLKLGISDYNSLFQEHAAFLRETWTALVIPEPGEELCEIASRGGLLLLAQLSGTNSTAREIGRLAKWPAVAMAIVDGGSALPAQALQAARNLMFAEAVRAEASIRLADWAQIAVVEVGELSEMEKRTRGCNLPMVAYRPELEPRKIEAARSGCDRLQRDLARYGDFAGYIV
ncbi:MAG: hypothetical protein IT427_13270 [Pirellulales bacterium]|nr:hypothetical protein [Pirellulales bacterium]